MTEVLRFIWLYPMGYKPIAVLNRWAATKYIKNKKSLLAPIWKFLWLKLRYPRWLIESFIALIVFFDSKRCGCETTCYCKGI